MLIAGLFPGQGSQTVGMGKDFFDCDQEAKKVFAEADEVLGFSISELCFDGPEDKLKQTQYTQPAILTVSYIIYRYAIRKGIKFSMVGGHSLGEYSALVAAGVIDFHDAVKLVHNRGKLMQESVPLGVGGMMAVMGLDRDKILDLCASYSSGGTIEAVNFNCPGQVVVAGEVEILKNFSTEALKVGAKKVIDLPVSAPFHSSMLRPAAEKFEDLINSTQFNDATLPVTSNVNGQLFTDKDTIKNTLKKQLCSSVYWEDCITTMVSAGAAYFLELGPGKVLSGFSKRIAKEIPVANVDSINSFDKVVNSVKG